MVLTQKNRLLNIKSPLGDDVLLLAAFSGQEGMSRLFSFQLELISDDRAIAPGKIVGENVTFNIELADGSRRHFNGFVNSFIAGDEEKDGKRAYRAEVVPWLWFLTRTADCRIFQNKTIPQIIEQVFRDLGFDDFELNLRLKHKTWEYNVQYRETDFNFVSRLMEQAGIFYFFKHEIGKHILVLSDHVGGYVSCPESEVKFPSSVGKSAIGDHLTSWEHRYEFRSGKWAQTDFNFEQPSASLMTTRKSVLQLPNIDKFEIYDHPGEYSLKDEGEAETRVRMEEEEACFDRVQASSTCKTFMAGGKFEVVEHLSDSEVGKSFLITSIHHAATETMPYETGASAALFDYRNSFTGIPAAVIFRPARVTPKPIISGAQTAIVVGPAGEEIYPDKYGRVKVQFHWDREGKRDENSSCWIRVSQVHAGKGWGSILIPRIGEEVIVDFLEGDPDRPIIIGRLYHAENMPPFGLPASKNVYGMKSNSTKGGGGYNEYVFDDTKGNELIREHGQFDKDSTIEHDLREHVLNDRSRDVTNNESIQIGVDRTEKVGSNESLTVGSNRTESVGVNETLSVGSDRSRSVGANESITVGLLRTLTVGINEAVTIGVMQEVTVGAAQAVTVGAGRALTVGASHIITVGASQTMTIGANLKETIGANRTESVAGNHKETVGQAYHVKVGKDGALEIGKNFSISAGEQIVLKTGKAEIIMKKDGTIQIKGKDIKLDASGKIVGTSSGKMTLKGSQITAN